MNTTPGTLDFEMKRYDSERVPFVQKLIYIVSAIGIVAALAFNNFH